VKQVWTWHLIGLNVNSKCHWHQMLRFSMWSDKFFLNQYDEEALIGWNGSSVIDQSVKQVQTQPTPLLVQMWTQMWFAPNY